MISSVNLALLAALAIVSPKDGEVVPTHKAAQKQFLNAPLAERKAQMDDAKRRETLFAAGATQLPLKVEWSGGTGGVFRLEVDYAGGGRRESFAVTNLTAVWLTNFELAQQYSVKVTDESGASAEVRFLTEADAPRFLRADGVSNFRDLGGWHTADGRRVRENRIFRSAGLRSSSKQEGGLFSQKVRLGVQRVTPDGIATLKGDFHIRTDLELRTPQETMGMDASLLAPEAKWKKVSFAAYDFVDNFVRGREPFARIFAVFADEGNYPILMHCSGGRDRTGTLAFLLNAILGVDENDLWRDWQASVFSDQGMGFTSSRMERLTAYLARLPGATLQERAVYYAKSCGVSDAEIAAFREIMLGK